MKYWARRAEVFLCLTAVLFLPFEGFTKMPPRDSLALLDRALVFDWKMNPIDKQGTPV